MAASLEPLLKKLSPKLQEMPFNLSHPDGEATTKKSSSMPSLFPYLDLNSKVGNLGLYHIFWTEAGLQLALQCMSHSLEAHIELVKALQVYVARLFVYWCVLRGLSAQSGQARSLEGLRVLRLTI